jgi:transcriptional regulator with XRE-family HTH domain
VRKPVTGRYFLGAKRNEREVMILDGMKAKAIRYFLGQSQAAFGKRIGVAASTICAIENNHREITDYIRSKLVRIEAELPAEFAVFYDKFRMSA